MSNSGPIWQRLQRFWCGRSGTVLRLILAVFPILWIVRNTDLGRVARYLLAADKLLLLVAYGTALSGPVIAALRWRLLIDAYGGDPAPRVITLLRHHLVGIYYGMIPTGLAGDALRGYRVRCFANRWTSYAVVAIERACGFAGLMFLTAAAAATAGGARIDETLSGFLQRALGIGAALALVFALLFLVLPYLIARSDLWRERLVRIPAVGALLARLPRPRALWPIVAAVGLSVLTQLVIFICTFLVARGPVPHISFHACAQAVPFVMLLSYFPVTPAAIGQRELLTVYFFGLVGVSPEAALTIAFLGFLVVLGVAATGGAVHLAERILGLEKPDPGGEPRRKPDTSLRRG